MPLSFGSCNYILFTFYFLFVRQVQRGAERRLLGSTASKRVLERDDRHRYEAGETQGWK